MCDYADFDRGNLFRHLKRYHPEAIEGVDSPTSLDPNTYENVWIRGDPCPSRNRQGCYKCDFCGYSNPDKADINLHVKKYHREMTNEPRFVSEVLPDVVPIKVIANENSFTFLVNKNEERAAPQSQDKDTEMGIEREKQPNVATIATTATTATTTTNATTATGWGWWFVSGLG